MRKGKVLQEFLVQRGLVVTRSPLGDETVALVTAEPVPLSEGKTAWNLFDAGAR